MASPNPYTPSYSFSGWQTANPAKPLPAPQLDNELANISSSLNAAIAALNQVRRSDGKLVNGIVTFDSLNNDLKAGFSGGAVSAWAPVVDYAAGINATPIAPATVVYYQGETYVCTVAHVTPSLFQTGNWRKIASRGANGTGSGDMLAALNLSDLANKPQARINLGLGNVDNTADADKPISTAAQAAITAGPFDFFIGCVPSRASNTSVAFSAGVGSFGGKKYTLPALTKLLNAVFAPGNNAGMLDTGSIQANKTYFLYSIRNATTGDGDYLASLSLTLPTVPAGWELLSGSRVGIILTNSSSQIRPFDQNGNQVIFDLTQEGSQTASFDTATFQPSSSPVGISTDVILWFSVSVSTGTTGALYASGPTGFLQGPAATVLSITGSSGNSQGTHVVRSRTTGSMRLTGIVSGSGTLQIFVSGWTDYQCRRLWA